MRLLRLTGARPAELFRLTPEMIDRDGEIWFADYGSDHKTARHGHRREVVFGPKAQAIPRPLLLRGADQPLFRESDLDAAEATKRLSKEVPAAPPSARTRNAPRHS